MRAVRSSEVVEALPFVEFSLQINVAFVAEKLIELLLIRTVGTFDFAIELRGAPFDVGVPDPEIFNMPMELGLEFVTIIRTDFTNAEWKLFDDVVNKVNRICLGMLLVDLEGANSGCIVDRRILEPADLFAAFPYECQKLNVHLNVMPWHLLLIAFGVQLAHSCASGQTVKAVTLKDTVDAGVGDFDAVVARQIPDDPYWPEVIFAPQIKHFVNDLSGRLIGWVLGN